AHLKQALDCENGTAAVTCQVKAAENASWAVVYARLRFLNDVPSVLKRQQYASAPWKFSSQESCFSSVALVLSRPVRSTRDELCACVRLPFDPTLIGCGGAIHQEFSLSS